MSTPSEIARLHEQITAMKADAKNLFSSLATARQENRELTAARAADAKEIERLKAEWRSLATEWASLETWLLTPERKPPALAFSAGPARRLADLVRHALTTDITTKAGAAAKEISDTYFAHSSYVGYLADIIAHIFTQEARP